MLPPFTNSISPFDQQPFFNRFAMIAPLFASTTALVVSYTARHYVFNRPIRNGSDSLTNTLFSIGLGAGLSGSVVQIAARALQQESLGTVFYLLTALCTLTFALYGTLTVQLQNPERRLGA